MKQACAWVSRIWWQAALALLAATILIPTIMTRGWAQAPPAALTFTTLYTFTGLKDGAFPSAGLVQDSAGNLYGTTLIGGGSTGCGTGGCGTVFKVSPTGVETLLHIFTGGADGANPKASLIRDASGNLYGTAFAGGSGSCPGGCGVVFKLSPQGTETVLYAFTGGADGGNPKAGLIQDAAGNFYGTTFLRGGPKPCAWYGYGCGTVFELSPAGLETVLYSFKGAADGGNSEAGLIRDAAGNLYGTALNGGHSGYGAVFELSPTGTETVLYSFSNGTNGGNPNAGLIQDAAGNLYGTSFYGLSTGICTGGCGTVFEVSSTGKETVLHSFAGGADGANPSGSLIQDAAGNFYGTASRGGSLATWPYGSGVVFKLAP